MVMLPLRMVEEAAAVVAVTEEAQMPAAEVVGMAAEVVEEADTKGLNPLKLSKYGNSNCATVTHVAHSVDIEVCTLACTPMDRRSSHHSRSRRHRTSNSIGVSASIWRTLAFPGVQRTAAVMSCSVGLRHCLEVLPKISRTKRLTTGRFLSGNCRLSAATKNTIQPVSIGSLMLFLCTIRVQE